MNIYVNNEPVQLSETVTIHLLLTFLGIKLFEGIAVAVDELVIKRSEWKSFKLHENQKITLITASQGG